MAGLSCGRMRPLLEVAIACKYKITRTMNDAGVVILIVYAGISQMLSGQGQCGHQVNPDG